MRRRQFIKGSAILGASLAVPRVLGANSGLFAVPSERRIAKILDAKPGMVQTVPIFRAFTGDQYDFVSPFVLLDEFGPLPVAPGGDGMTIEAHPHAGVTPTTYLLSGSGRHTDSLANDIIYKEGQFMLFSSGRGAIHEEVSDEGIKSDGGTVHGFQIWLNLPAAEKFSDPVTSIHDHAALPIIETEKYRLKVVIGEAFGQRAATHTYTPVFYYHIHLPAGGQVEIPTDPTHNAFAYMIDGEVETAGQQIVSDRQIALYARGDELIRLYSEKGCELMLLGGKPLNEPLVTYGPFVMNTQEQIQQCFQNYRSGNMGHL